MANPLPSNNSRICLLARQMGKGILECGPEAGVTMVTAAEMIEAAAALKDTEFSFGAYACSPRLYTGRFPARHARAE